MSRELILEWVIFILIGHPLPNCLLSIGLVLILTAFSSCLKLRAHPGHPAPYEPSLPVPLISLLTANLQTLIQKAVTLVKVLLRQVRVIFQTWCRFFVGAGLESLPGGGEWCALLCLPGVPKPDRSLSPTKPQLHSTPPGAQCEHLTFSCTDSSQTLPAFWLFSVTLHH